MSNYKPVKEYLLEFSSLGRQRFLVLNPSPVLLMLNPASEPKPQNPGSSGFHTRAAVASTAPSKTPPKQQPLVPNERFLVIPIVKGEGHPFPERVGVGRTKGTDITLGDRDVSKYHGYFSSQNERWFFTDGGSSNGTFIKGERVPPMVASPLEDEVEMGFGTVRCLFRTAVGFCNFVSR